MLQTPNHIDENQKRNAELLNQFKFYLKAQGNDAETIEAHEFNLDFYLNHYLIYGGVRTVEEGASPELVRDFLGNFFVHKAMWTDVEEQKSSIQSLLLFYCWFEEKTGLPGGNCGQLQEMIQAEQEGWFAAMERYAEESLETWQSAEDADLLEGSFFSELDLIEDVSEASLGEEIDAIEIPGLEDSLVDPDDAMLLELVPSDEAENDPD